MQNNPKIDYIYNCLNYNAMRQNERENIWKYSLVVLIIGLGLLLFTQARQFLSGALGALTLYIILRKPMFRLTEKVRNPTFASIILLLGTVLFFIIPVTLLIWLVISKLQQANLSTDAILAPVSEMINVLKDRYGIDLISEKNISFAAGKLTLALQSFINGIGGFSVNVLAALVILFFLLQGGRKMENYIASVIPLKKVNTREVINRVNLMVKSNAIGIPLIAVMQGLIAWAGYAIFNVPNAFLAAFLTGVCSVVPIVGTMVIWIPISIYFAVLGQWGTAIGLFFFCAICIAQSDNLFRFILQKKLADTHPLITIFGVIAGLPLFGFMGIIFGPILVSLFLLFIDMFRKEYLSYDDED